MPLGTQLLQPLLSQLLHPVALVLDERCQITATEGDCEHYSEIFASGRTLTQIAALAPEARDGAALTISTQSGLRVQLRVRARNGGYTVLATTASALLADQPGKAVDERFRRVAQRVPALISYVDRDQRYVFVNRMFEQWYGKRAEEVVGRSVREVRGDAAYQGLREHIDTVLQGREVSFERDLNQFGLARYIRSTFVPDFDADGAVAGYYVLATDLTERRAAQEADRIDEERFRLITEHVTDLIALVDAKGRRVYNSPSYRSLFGDELLVPGSDSFEQIHPDDREHVLQVFRDTVATGVGRAAHFRFRLPDGSVRYIESRGNVIRDRVGQTSRVVVVSRDITERLSTEQSLRHLAHHDFVTNLPNRALLIDRLQHALDVAQRNKQCVAVLFVDLDDFKTINDTLGHAVGDQLLRAVAERLLGCLRQSDTVARHGGDEFIVLLENVDSSAEAASVAGKLVDALSRPFVFGTRNVRVSASVGASVFPDHGDSVEVLIRNADAAMYYAKSNGKRRAQLFDAQIDQALRQRIMLDVGLRDAGERGEFLVQYQPRWQLADGSIACVEALVRWQHPELGLLKPLRFIPLADESGQSVRMGEWMLRQACQQARRWHASGDRVRVAVNVTGRQFRQPDFVLMVAAILEEADLDPKWLELELTESSLMRRADTTALTLQRLRQLGVSVAIDDFGTGYSSLPYLKRFEIDRIKIDNSFVQDLPVDASSCAIVRAMMAMAHSLGIRVTAEGVETTAQLEMLRDLGCDEVQGFLFGQPVLADETLTLLRSVGAGEHATSYLFSTER